jgi:hypothetical protein
MKRNEVNTCKGINLINGEYFVGIDDDGKKYGWDSNTTPCTLGVKTTVPYNPPNIILNSNNGNTNNDFYLTSSTIGVYNSSYSNTGIMEGAERNPLKNGISQNNWDLGNFNIPNVNSSGGGIDSGNGFSSSENYLFSRISQSTNSMVKQLKTGEWSLGINTASFSGRASKDNDGISNQVKGCFDWVQQKGGISTLRLLTFKECDLTEVDMVYYCNQMAGYSVRFEYLDFSYNRINDSGIRCLFKHSFIPTGTYAKHIVNLNLSNNNIGDDSAKIISQALVDGKMPATKSIDVSGNNITKDGYKSLMTSLESTNVKSMMVTLVQKQINFYDKTNKAFKDTVDFVTKGLKYAIDEHNKDMKGTKWDGTTVRTDSMDKWKSCKEVEQNVQKGVIGGLIKCSATPKTPHAMFACVLKDIGMELLDPDTLWCAVEINEFVKETDIIGDNCNIF